MPVLSVLPRRKSFASWKEFLSADSLRSLRLGDECGGALSTRGREGRKENAKKTNLLAASPHQVNPCPKASFMSTNSFPYLQKGVQRIRVLRPGSSRFRQMLAEEFVRKHILRPASDPLL